MDSAAAAAAASSCSIKVLHFLLLVFCVLFHHSSLALSSESTSSSAGFPNEAIPTKSGYLPVSSTSSSAMYYAFYEANNSTLPLSRTPLLIWLQGGPGCSSMLANFLELGPFLVTEDLSLKPNPGSWNRIFGLLFLDNPIGAGFSFAANYEEIPRDQHAVARHLFAAITGFVELDPVFKNRPIYITGESYAGKYVPAIGYYILKKNMKLPLVKQVNLHGLAIGNGLTDPLRQVKTHALNAYYSGFINERQKSELEEAQNKAVELVKMGKWSAATDARSNVLGLLRNMTGLATLYDFTRKKPYRESDVSMFLQPVEVKKALRANASIAFEACNDVAGDALHDDVMKSVKYMVEFLVKKTKVLLYQGHHDLRDGVVSTEAWIKTMKWEGIGRFLMADRKIWDVNGELAGYVQKYGSLTQTVVLGAGHLVPTDQPLNAQAMIEDWVLEKGIFASAKEEENLASDSRGELDNVYCQLRIAYKLIPLVDKPKLAERRRR